MGALLVQNYVTPFMGMYDDLRYDDELHAYVGSNISCEQNGSTFMLYEVKVQFYANGKVKELHYISDILRYSGDDTVGEEVGKSTLTISFSDYGTTIVELPVIE
jgi:hypothetical protein